MDREEIENRFGYNPPRSTARVKDHEFTRDVLEWVAHKLNNLLPEGREKSLAITKLEEAMFWANAALARSHDPDATSTVEEAAAGPRLGEGEPALDRDDEEREATTLRKGSPFPDLEEYREEEEGSCVEIAEVGQVCGLPVFGYIIMGGGKKKPMCEYHWREDGSGHAKERIR